MNKKQFLDELRDALSNLPEKDIKDSLDYYSEIIDDKIESEISEEAAIAEIGMPSEAAREIKLNAPLSSLIKSKYKKYRSSKTLRIWEMLFVILGSPIWLSLVIVALAVILAVYISIWGLFAAIWAVDLSLWALALGGVVLFGVNLFGSPAYALLCLGLGLFCAGASVLLFFACLKSTALFLKLTVIITNALKKIIIGRD